MRPPTPFTGTKGGITSSIIPAPPFTVGSSAANYTCFNAPISTSKGRADQTALIYDSPVTNQRKFTFRELRDKVAHFAGVLAPPASTKAIVSSSICRWCPSSGGNAWLCAARGRPFSGLRRLCS